MSPLVISREIKKTFYEINFRKLDSQRWITNGLEYPTKEEAWAEADKKAADGLEVRVRKVTPIRH